MKSYISRKFPLETITTDLIFEARGWVIFDALPGDAAVGSSHD
jgi:hypothetical protein